MNKDQYIVNIPYYPKTDEEKARLQDMIDESLGKKRKPARKVRSKLGPKIGPKMPRCEKTVSGKHDWSGAFAIYDASGGRRIPRCIYCSMIDDTK